MASLEASWIGANSGVNTNSVETVNSIDYDDGYYFSELFKHRFMTTCRTIEIYLTFLNLRYWMCLYVQRHVLPALPTVRELKA